MKKINLYLDDLRPPPRGFIIAREIETAKVYFETHRVNILSLDHDLGSRGGINLPTGYDFVKYFCENGLHADEIYIHTANPVGRENMYKTLLAARDRGFIAKDIKIYNYAMRGE